MNILEAMAYLSKSPNNVVYRTSWLSERYINLRGNPSDANTRSSKQPECYCMWISKATSRISDRMYEFDYCDVVANDWEIWK